MKDEFFDKLVQSVGKNQISMLRFTMFIWFTYMLLMLFMTAFAYNKNGLAAVSTFLPSFGGIGFTFAVLYGNKPHGVRMRDTLWKFFTGYVIHFPGHEEVKVIKTIEQTINKSDYYIAGHKPLVFVFKDKKTAVLAKMVL